MNAIVVGYGMIGKERIKALQMLPDIWIVGIVDPQNKKDAFANSIFVKHIEDIPKEIINKTDWVFVCTPHDETIEIVRWALKNKCNVLAEKPLGRNLHEYLTLTCKPSFDPQLKIHVGFNYRFYKGVRQLLIDCQNKLFGDLISVNMVIGLSNAPGTEKTWRLDPEKAGSGSIIYAGIHLIDIAMLIGNGDLIKMGFATSGRFWKTGIEEEMHILAKDKNNTIYNIQSSVDRWRSTFRIEVNGTEGYGIIEGRNKHYGPQTYIRGKKWGWQSGKSQRESEEIVVSGYDGEDSFYEETKAVLFGCNDYPLPATHIDNLNALKFIENGT
jgi:predicted dehydrogenase